jgi:uncharacterized protein (TIGR02246 family)
VKNRLARVLGGLALLTTVTFVGIGCGSSTSNGSTTTTAPSSVTCQPITDAQVTGLFDKWNADVQSGDPDRVVADYAVDSVLLPTLSDQPRFTQAERRAYFVDFLAKGPTGKITNQTVTIGCDTVANSGLYTFTFKDGTTADARFTYVYEYVNGEWLIQTHHSSMQPAAGH